MLITTITVGTNIFSIVDHLNHSVGRLKRATPEERYKLCEWNLKAGSTARRSDAYENARSYFATGLGLLPSDSWQGRYETALALYLASAECEYMCGNLALATSYFQQILHNARSVVDQAAAYGTHIWVGAAAGRWLEAINSAVAVCRLLGWDINASPTEEEAKNALRETEELLGEWAISDLYHLPEATDQTLIQLSNILSVMLPIAYCVDTSLFTLVACKLAQISLSSGHSSASCIGYAYFGVVLAMQGAFKRAYDFGDLAFKLSKEYDTDVQGETAAVYASYLHHWNHPLMECLPLLTTAYHNSWHSGDVVFAALSALNLTTIKIWIGQPMGMLLPEAMKVYQMLSTKVPGRELPVMMAGNIQLIRAMTQVKHREEGDSSSEDQLDAALRNKLRALDDPGYESIISDPSNNMPVAWCWYLCFKLQARYLLAMYEDALLTAQKCQKVIETLKGQPQITFFYFYYSLTLAAIIDTVPSKRKAEYIHIIQSNQAELRKWAINSPLNFLQKYV